MKQKVCFRSLDTVVQPKMKISPWCTHPQVIKLSYDILLSYKCNQSYVKNGLALPSFV